MKKYLTIFCVIALLTAMLAGCGANSAAVPETMQSYTMDMTTGATATEDSKFSYADGAGTEPSAAPAEVPENPAEKIIYTANVVMETREFDSTITALDKAVADVDGFVENSEISGDSTYSTDGSVHIRNRRAYYTVRVPAGKLDAFLTQTGGMGNVISSSKSAQNVTSQYTDYEARLTSLNTQENRLLELMEKAEDIEALITLESKLADVRYEIESIQRELNNLDSRIAYSTVEINVWEVEVYQPTASTQRTFGQRMGDSFKSGWRGFVRGLQNFCVALSGSVFTLLLLAAVGAACFFVGKAVVRKHRSKKVKKENTEN